MTPDLYAIIDPRDNYTLEYLEGRERALEYARELENSSAYGYQSSNIKLRVRKVA